MVLKIQVYSVERKLYNTSNEKGSKVYITQLPFNLNNAYNSGKIFFSFRKFSNFYDAQKISNSNFGNNMQNKK